jgi:hypothetical protein
MSDSELAIVSVDSFQAPALIARAGPSTRKKFFEFFTVPIRNANTRAAYYRAIQPFLTWAERAGYQDLEDIEPITVAAYIKTLQRRPSAQETIVGSKNDTPIAKPPYACIPLWLRLRKKLIGFQSTL